MSRAEKYCQVAVDRAVEEIHTAGVGERNTILFRQACGIGRIVAGGYLDAGDAAQFLLAPACGIGLPEREARQTILAGFRRGYANPLQLADSPRERQRITARAKYCGKAAPAPINVPPDVLPLARDIWRAVADHALGEDSIAWLRSRGLSPLVAEAYGCRDLQCDEVRAALNAHSRDAQRRMGLLGRGRDGRERQWAGVADARFLRGLAFPVYHPDHAFPVSWRLRLHDPRDVKSLAVYGPVEPWRDWPLGVRWGSTGEGYHQRKQRDGRTVEPVGSCGQRAIVVEGEPDFLAMSASIANIEVLGDCAASRRNHPEHWRNYLAGADALIYAYHDDETGRAKMHAIAEGTPKIHIDDLFSVHDGIEAAEANDVREVRLYSPTDWSDRAIDGDTIEEIADALLGPEVYRVE